MGIRYIRGVLHLLKFRRAKSDLRNFLRRSRRLEQALFRILRYRYSRTLSQGREPKTSQKSWQKRNNIIRSLAVHEKSSFPLSKRRAVKIYSQGVVAFQSTFITKNHLVGGEVLERPFCIYKHEVKFIEFHNVNFWRFKYVYDDQSIHLYEQFISEFSDEYYGRNSDVFFATDKSQALGDFPKTKGSYYRNQIYSIFGQYYNNYWHFMMEYLPKLLLIPKGSIVLMPRDLAFAEQFKLIARKMHLDILAINPNRANFFKTLIVFTTPVKYIDSKNTSIDIVLLKELQKKWREIVPLIPIDVGQKVFLLRKSIRRLNVDLILQKTLKDKDYALLDLTSKSYEFQMSLFSGDHLIAGYPGANWANLVYFNGNSFFVNLVSVKNVDQSLHHALARVFGAEIRNIALCSLGEFKSLDSNSYLDSETATLDFDSESAIAVREILNQIIQLSQ